MRLAEQQRTNQLSLDHPDLKIPRRFFVGILGLGAASFGMRVVRESLKHDSCDYRPFNEGEQTLLRALVNKGTWSQTSDGYKAQSGNSTVHVAKGDDCYLVSIGDSQNHLHHFVVKTMKRGSCPEDTTLLAEYDLAEQLYRNAAEQAGRNKHRIASR